MEFLLRKFFVAAFLLAVNFPFTSFAITFTPLGFINDEPSNTRAYGISANGRVVVGESRGAAFMWSKDTGILSLGDFAGGSYSSVARSVSADGSVIVGTGTSGLSKEGFRWTASTGLIGLGDYSNQTIDSYGFAVSADGNTIAGQASLQPTRWTFPSNIESLGDLSGGGWHGSASGISADGSVVTGTSTSSLGVQAFRWTSYDGISVLGLLDGGTATSFGRAVSGNGSVIVGEASSQDGIRAFRWDDQNGMTALGRLENGLLPYSALAASWDGSVIVGGNQSGNAFVWDEANGSRTLHGILQESLGSELDGWNLYAATSISADGATIAGWGVNPDGYQEAWVANTSVVPLPPALYLFGSGLLALVGFSKCGRQS